MLRKIIFTGLFGGIFLTTGVAFANDQMNNYIDKMDADNVKPLSFVGTVLDNNNNQQCQYTSYEECEMDECPNGGTMPPGFNCEYFGGCWHKPCTFVLSK